MLETNTTYNIFLSTSISFIKTISSTIIKPIIQINTIIQLPMSLSLASYFITLENGDLLITENLDYLVY